MKPAAQFQLFDLIRAMTAGKKDTAQEPGSRYWCGAVVSLHLQATNAPLRG